MPDVHARFSPSSFGRLIQCPASLKLCESLPDSTTQYSRTGTSAHTICENMLNTRLGRAEAFSQEEMEELEGFDRKMLDNATAYADFVMEQYERAKTERGDAEIYIEHQVQIPGIGKKKDTCFGTGDAIIFAPGLVHVIDYKNGITPVEVAGNPQLLAYAFGAVNELGLVWGCEDVKLSIFQPNIGNVATWPTGWKDVEEWFEGTLVPATKDALSRKPSGKAGDHCKFCRAKATCGWNADMVHEIAVKGFKEPGRLLEAGEVEHFLGIADRVIDWIGALKDWALARALEGDDIPGWKLVEGKSNRSWADEGAAAEAIKAIGFDPYREPSLKTLGDIERMVGEDQMQKWMEDGVLVKPAGKPTLAPSSDKRPAISTATMDFADELKE